MVCSLCSVFAAVCRTLAVFGANRADLIGHRF
jgi:hypothetical protein